MNLYRPKLYFLTQLSPKYNYPEIPKTFPLNLSLNSSSSSFCSRPILFEIYFMQHIMFRFERLAIITMSNPEKSDTLTIFYSWYSDLEYMWNSITPNKG